MKEQHQYQFRLIFSCKENEQSYVLERKETGTAIFKIGSDIKSDLRIQEPNVSRMHAVIEVDSGGNVVLIDLGSQNGTLVNGARINKCNIEDCDTIQIGEKCFELVSIEVDGKSQSESKEKSQIKFEIEQIIKFKVFDGATFDTRKEAEEYLVCCEMQEILSEQKGRMEGYMDFTWKCAEQIVKHKDGIIKLLQTLEVESGQPGA